MADKPDIRTQLSELAAKVEGLEALVYRLYAQNITERPDYWVAVETHYRKLEQIAEEERPADVDAPLHAQLREALPMIRATLRHMEQAQELQAGEIASGSEMAEPGFNHDA